MVSAPDKLHESLSEYLQAHGQDGLITLPVQQAAARIFDRPFPEVEEAILELQLLPARYARNRNTLTCAQQLTLFQSAVAVIGCGGLGCYIIEELARIGVGRITAIDPDIFAEHNLNRQLYASPGNLGQAKVECAAQRVKEINPAVTVTPVQKALDIDNGRELLENIRVATDALDSITGRIELAHVCRSCNIPLVHGSVGGWYGQVATEFPGDGTLERIYARCQEDRGIEKELGNLAFAVAVVASMEVAEVVKILLGEEASLRRKMLSVNLLDMEICAMEV
jgi:molybdopterin/thiamine biosynthesis adenylyltransferase